MPEHYLPNITCPHCKNPIFISMDVLFSGGVAECKGCGSELKVNQNEDNQESLDLLKEFVDKINQIKG